MYLMWRINNSEWYLPVVDSRKQSDDYRVKMKTLTLASILLLAALAQADEYHRIPHRIAKRDVQGKAGNSQPRATEGTPAFKSK